VLVTPRKEEPQINGVEHVMSIASPGPARTGVLVRLYDRLNTNADWLPAGLGVLASIINPKGIDGDPP
jgi:hypothetical protein